MKRISITFSLIITFFAFFNYTNAVILDGFRFEYDLKKGDTNADVRALQEILNGDNLTIVATEGPGSKGNETEYFGEKTKSAVISFQELYASEILIPNNLTKGTGFVGPSTRNKLNAILSEIESQNNITTNDYSDDSFIDEQANKRQESESNSDSKHSIFTESSLETSTQDADRPILTNVSPLKISKSTQKITITGDKFHATSNVVYGTLGEITNIESKDGKTLTFSLNDFSSFEEAKSYYAGGTINIYMRVSNPNGYSADLAVVSYRFPGTQVSNSNFQTVGTDSQNQNINNQNNQNTSGCNTNKSCNTSSSQSSSSKSETSGDPLGITKKVGEKDKMIWGFSPQGMLIKQIGGEELFDTVYSFSPSGTLLGGGASSGEESGGDSGTGAGAAGGILGGALGGGAAGGSSGGGTTGVADFFGGSITQVTYCTCSAGVLLYVQDLATKSVLPVVYQYGVSVLHANYNVFSSGVNVIGGYTPGGQCLVYAGTSCSTGGTPTGTIDTIRGVGTSSF